MWGKCNICSGSWSELQTMGLHVIQCHKLLVLTAATRLCRMRVKKKKTHATCAYQDNTQRNVKLQIMYITKYCTLESTIFTGGSHFLLLQSLQLNLWQSITLYLSCYATSIIFQNLREVAGNNTHQFLW